jgi:hypothetical protein
MASVAVNFRAAVMEWVANEIASEEKRILYGTGVGIPKGIINCGEEG